MWAYEFVKKDTRYKVTGLKNFLKINHDLPKLWYEEDNVQPEMRTNFFMRVLKFYTYFNLLIIFVYTLIDFDDQYYLDTCHQRTEWYNYWNNDFFPDLQCQDSSANQLDYMGNIYDNLYEYPQPTNSTDYRIWANYIKDNSDYKWIDHKDRQVRIHTCFKYWNDEQETGFKFDNRPLCSSLTPANQNKILCAYPDDDCEYTQISSEVVISDSGKDSISFSPLIAFYAALIVSPVYFIFDILSILLARLQADTVYSLKESSKVMAFQVAMTSIFIIVFLVSIHHIVITHKFARPELLWFTFLFSLIIDQIKTLGFLCMVWYILIKRCAYLTNNEEEFVQVEDPEDVKQELFIPKLKVFCLIVLESSYFENTSIALISIYTIFIFYWLTISDILQLTSTETLSIIDTMFLSLFLSEITMKTFASTFRYLSDKFNCFDAIIVVISFILNLMGIVAKGLGVLRLIRVGVITVRKITGKEDKLRHQSKNIDPVNSVIKILKQVLELQQVSLNVKKECTWAIDIIESNKLYDLNFDLSNKDKNLEIEARTWVNFASDAANDTTLWFERDLDDFLKEIHR